MAVVLFPAQNLANSHVRWGVEKYQNRLSSNSILFTMSVMKIKKLLYNTAV
jgi:hypothetical protein